MRIRKRKVPLPLSLLSPVPLSDPHLFSQFPVHHQPQPSDHVSPTTASDLHLLPLIVVANSSSNNNTIVSSAGVQKEEEEEGKERCLEFQGGGGERILQHKSNYNNDDDGSKQETKMTMTMAMTMTTTATTSNAAANEVRWSEGERVIPLKKRRSSSSSGGFVSSEKDVENENKNNKQKRGTTIMEGSRCSRVNGRGWRCCQATLVGYSLCEHHLGKGRLRSMTTVRGRPAKKHHQPKASNNNKKKKKRVSHKLGVVKARSLSSLLGQVNTVAAVVTTTNNVDLDLDLNVDGDDIMNVT